MESTIKLLHSNFPKCFLKYFKMVVSELCMVPQHNGSFDTVMYGIIDSTGIWDRIDRSNVTALDRIESGVTVHCSPYISNITPSSKYYTKRIEKMLTLSPVI